MSSPRKGFRCYHCDEEGHIARVCPNKPPQLCFNCGQPGHIKRNCPELARGDTRHAPRDERPVEEPKFGEQGLLVEVTGFEQDTRTEEPPPAAERARETAKHTPTQSYMPHPLSPSASVTTFIDTHCHLEYVFERFKHNGTFAEFALKHSYPANFGGCITTFCDPMAFSPSFGVWQELLTEPNVWGTFGTHPHNAKYYHSSSLEEKMLVCLSHPKCVALGEIGLDYAPHSPSDQDTQKSVLSLQIELAVGLKKPIVLHCRDAEDDLFEILTTTVPHDWKLHLHCYTGSLEMARKFLKNFPNLYVGVCGNVTYDSTRVRATAAGVPLNRLLLETDAPYMVPRNLPQHLHGNSKFSHPSLAFYTAREIARIRHITVAEVLQSLRENTRYVYGI